MKAQNPRQNWKPAGQGANRRSMLRKIGAAVCAGSLSLNAGCLGDTGNAGGGPDLQIADRDAEITTFGNVVATVTVVNEGDEAGTGEVWVEVDLNGGDSFTESEVVRVEPGTTQTYEIEVDVGVVDALSSDQANIEIWLEA